MLKSLDSTYAHNVHSEQTKLLYESIPTANLAYVMSAIVLTSFLWDVIDHLTLIVWLAANIALVAARLVFFYLYNKSDPAHPLHHRWQTRFNMLTIISGCIWGSASLLLFSADSLIHQIFLIFIVGGMCIGSLSTLAPALFPLLTFIFLSTLPLFYHLLHVSPAMNAQMAFMIAIFLLIITISAIRMNSRISQYIQLRIRTEEQEKTIAGHKLQQRNIVDHAPVGIWLTDLNGRFKLVNKTCCDALGIPEEKFLQDTRLNQLLGEDVATHCLQSDQACLQQDEAYLSHEALTFVDGQQHLMEITKVKLRDESENVTGILGISLDITRRHRNEERLKKLSQAIEQSSESIMITDPHGTIEYVNPSFTTITGYSEQEAIGQTPRILKSEQHSTEFYQELWQTITSGHLWSGTITDKRKDGSTFPSSVTISPIKNKSGQISHFVATQQDTTASKQLEEQLMQAQKMDAIGVLVGGIAHDFNNMLAAVTGQLHILKEMVPDSPEVIRKLEFVEKLSFDSSDMIKQLLTFARKTTIEMKPLQLNVFAREISKISVAGIPENIEFYRRFSDHNLIIKADATQLQQVLMNLLNNARDALKGATNPKISYIIKKHTPNADFKNRYPEQAKQPHAHIIIKDNGTGIRKEDIDHVFEPFFTTKDVGSGTGLGLSMVYGAVQSHGGIIEVASKLGKGTTFHLYLPLIDAAQPIETKTEVVQNRPGNGEVILLVDDNEDVRNIGRVVLHKLGYQVLEAVDGREAVDVFRENQHIIALTIMDVIMPKLGGLPASQLIRAIKPEAKVIFTTGYDQQELQSQDALDETLTVITKPYRIHQFSEIVWRELNQ